MLYTIYIYMYYNNSNVIFCNAIIFLPITNSDDGDRVRACPTNNEEFGSLPIHVPSNNIVQC